MELTQEVLRDLVHYDPETGIFTWKRRPLNSFKSEQHGKTWNTKYAGKEAGSINRPAVCKTEYICIKIHNKAYLAHRLAWLYLHGFWPDNIDHIDGNGRNNRELNLRDVSLTDNRRNMRQDVRNTSGVTGVYRQKHGRKPWMSSISHQGKSVRLGGFDDWFEAVCARKSAELKYGYHENHGEVRERRAECVQPS